MTAAQNVATPEPTPAPATPAPPAAVQAPAMVSVTVVAGRQAFVDGHRHEPGETFTVSPELAEHLRRDGHVVAANS